MSPLSRRDLVARGLALGLSWSSLAALLQACGPATPRASDDPDATLGAVEPELHIYTWSDYLAPEVVRDFGERFHVRVSVDTYESNEEMVAKLAVGGGGYDVIVPSSYLLPVLTGMGALQVLKRRYLTGLGNVAPTFRDTPNDPGGRYAVPFAWGTTGIAYRSDLVAAPPTSWGVFEDPALSGRMTMMDEAREVLGAFLRYRGHSLNSSVPAELAAARADALVAKPLLKAYLSAPVKAQLVAGDVWVAQLWNGDTYQARAEQARSGAGTIAFALPTEGSQLWLDTLAIPATAAHPRAAHEFLDYCLRPEVAAANAAFNRYGSPNEAAQRLITEPIPYPSAAELARLEYLKDLGRDAATWDRIWTEVKAS